NRLLGIASVSVFLCAAQSNAPSHSILNQNDVTWSKGPASLPPGAEVAVLEGDPAKEGQFTMRLRLPDGYKVPRHWHPKVEHVTIFSGTFRNWHGRALRRKGHEAHECRLVRILARWHETFRFSEGDNDSTVSWCRTVGHQLRATGRPSPRSNSD